MKKLLAVLSVPVLLLVLSFTALGIAYRSEPEIAPGFPGKMLDLGGGLKVRYVQAGQGPDLLLVHGCPGTVEDWDPLFDELSRRFRVTAYDRPGYGFSSDPHDRFSLAYNSEVARKVMDALDLKDVIWVGHSYGAGVGLNYLVSRPDDDRVKGFVFLGVPAYGPVERDGLTRLLAVPGLGRGLAVALLPVIGEGKVKEGVLRGFAPNGDAVTPRMLRQRVILWSRPDTPVARARELAGLEEELAAMRPHYPGIRRKFYMVQGNADTITMSAWPLKQDARVSELEVLDGVGHYPQFVEPDAVVSVIGRAAAHYFDKGGRS